MQPKPSACHRNTILYQQRSFSPGVKCIRVNQLFSNTLNDYSCAFVDVIKKGCCDVITVSVTGSSTLTVRAGRGCKMKTSAEKLDFTVVHSMWALCTLFLRPFPIKMIILFLNMCLCWWYHKTVEGIGAVAVVEELHSPHTSFSPQKEIFS